MSPGAANKSKKHASAREALAANIVALRREKGWSQEALAFECGLHRTFVAHVERLSRNISLDNVERLANALGVETYELLQPRRDL
jgi:transcriptional regulator with XRE-family HTH domain